MGLTRGSFYKAFLDKKSLFLNVLNRYETEAVDPTVALLTTGDADGLDRIEALFDHVISAVETGDQRGCLLCSAAAGPAAVDDDISELVHLQLNKMQDAFLVALTQSQRFKSATPQTRQEMASMLLTQYVGLRILVRSHGSVETIRQSARAIMQALGPAP